MSVLIKGIEMPKGCAFCRIGKRNGKKMGCPLCDEEWDIHDPMSADHRLDNCPLRLVPPHGRLGDLDAAAELVMQYCPDDDGTCSKAGADLRDLLDEIENLPTIIPAEPCNSLSKPCRKEDES